MTLASLNSPIFWPGLTAEKDVVRGKNGKIKRIIPKIQQAKTVN